MYKIGQLTHDVDRSVSEQSNAVNVEQINIASHGVGFVDLRRAREIYAGLFMLHLGICFESDYWILISRLIIWQIQM